MDPSLPKVLMLVLASDTDPLYCAFQILWRQMMEKHPNIDVYFYKGHPNLCKEAFLSDSRTLLVKCEEGLGRVYEKTLKAFEFFLPRLSKYDFVFRTNLSSFIVFEKYLEFCKLLPKESCCSAFVGVTHDGIHFPAGAGFTITPDLIKRLVQEKPELHTQDDVTIGIALAKWGIPIIPAIKQDILFKDDREIIDDIPIKNCDLFHYRIKNLEDRNIDIYMFQKLLNKYYND